MLTDRAASPPAWTPGRRVQACRSGESAIAAETVMNNAGYVADYLPQIPFSALDSLDGKYDVHASERRRRLNIFQEASFSVVRIPFP
jgi:hypothetical protein